MVAFSQRSTYAMVKYNLTMIVTTLAVLLGLCSSSNSGVEAKKPIPVGGKSCYWTEGCTDYTLWAQTTPLKAGEYVSFRYQTAHNVVLFPTKESWDTCNITVPGIQYLTGIGSTNGIPNGWSKGTGAGLLVKVTDKPKYIACTTPNDLDPKSPPFHCLGGMKVVIQAGYGKPRYHMDFVIGGFVDYQKFVDKRRKYKIGTSFALRYECCHDVWAFPDETSYKTCNFTKATFLAGEKDAKCGGYPVYVQDKPTYYGCSIGEGVHCQLGMKFMLPAGV